MGTLFDRAYREKITIPSAKVISDEVDYTVTFVETGLSATFWANVKADGGDIIIADDDGETRVGLDIIAIDTGAKTIEYKTMKPVLDDGTDNEMWAYYGNAGGSQPAASAPYGSESAYDSNTVLVFPFSKDPDGATTLEDRTGYGNDATSFLNAGTADWDDTGLYGDRSWFGDQFVNRMELYVPDAAELRPPQHLTIEAVIKAPGGTALETDLIDNGSLGYNYTFRLKAGSLFRTYYVVLPTLYGHYNAAIISAGWEYYSMVVDTTTNRLDNRVGSTETTTSGATVDMAELAETLTINAQGGASNGYSFGYEEIIISNASRSSGAMETRKNNLTDMANFYTVGASEPSPPTNGNGGNSLFNGFMP